MSIENDAMSGKPLRYVREDKYLALLAATREFLAASDAEYTARHNNGKRLNHAAHNAIVDASRRRRDALIALEEIANPKEGTQ